MNKIESVIYNFIKYNPRLKNAVRDIYQALFYLIPVQREKPEFPVTVREGFFFGFHDKNPWSSDNLYLLSHGYHRIPNKVPKIGDQIDIGFFKGDNFSLFQKITSTSCYNWQQGSMLQWLGKTNKFIFNDAGERTMSPEFSILKERMLVFYRKPLLQWILMGTRLYHTISPGFSGIITPAMVMSMAAIRKLKQKRLHRMESVSSIYRKILLLSYSR